MRTYAATLLLLFGGCSAASSPEAFSDGGAKIGDASASDARAAAVDAASGAGDQARDGSAADGAAEGGGGATAADGGTSGATDAVDRYGVFERSFSYASAGVVNPWEDVTLGATITTPSGAQHGVHGFYYDAAAAGGDGIYVLRYTPAELGDYSFEVTLAGPSGMRTEAGSFTAVASSHPGFLRVHPSRPERLVFEASGKLANAFGFNTCFARTVASPLVADLDVGQNVPIETFFATWGQEGVGANVFRFGPDNCAFPIFETVASAGNTYALDYGKRADELLATAKRHGFHVLFTVFANNGASTHTLIDVQVGKTAQTKRALDYVLARYGAYVDAFEIVNEVREDSTQITDAWLAELARYVHDRDPHHRIVTNSYERASDFTTGLHARDVHQSMASDGVAMGQAFQQSGGARLAVFAGEVYQPTSSNWDAQSAQRVRQFTWTTLFSGVVGLYWNRSDVKGTTGANGNPVNVYLGAEERGYLAHFAALTGDIDADAAALPVTVSGGAGTKAYALGGAKQLLLYAFVAPGGAARTNTLSFDAPLSGSGSWYDPRTGTTLGAPVSIGMGQVSLVTPSFAQDVVLVVR